MLDQVHLDDKIFHAAVGATVPADWHMDLGVGSCGDPTDGGVVAWRPSENMRGRHARMSGIREGAGAEAGSWWGGKGPASPRSVARPIASLGLVCPLPVYLPRVLLGAVLVASRTPKAVAAIGGRAQGVDHLEDDLAGDLEVR